MRRDKDYGWVWPVLGCFLLTVFIVWLFSIILPSIRVEGKIFNNFLTQMKNFESLEGWFLLVVVAFLISAMITGIALNFWRFSLRKIKSKRIDKQKAFR
ncbi:MAG: hypothetical protein NT052_00455 [Candidatus Shapirobacteria bacterium]|nr:hypothetical protein [Candidatus Shapirobacteria bacterium]